MNAKAKKALKESIEHWERLAGNKPLLPGEYVGGESCPLCNLFFNPSSSSPCEGCPIYELTKHSYCRYTPYVYAREQCMKHGIQSPEFRVEAEVELNFLKALLGEKKK